MTDVLAFLAATGVVPVVVIDDPARSEALAQALIAGGLPTAEITLRTPAALEAIRALADVPGFAVGAGTIVDPSQVTKALEAGATYLVSPGFSLAVSRECATLGVPLIPGVATPTELMAALDAGHQMVKFFPAGAAGGVAMLKALAAPFPSARFMPTGGISLASLADYLVVPAVAAVGGTWIASREAIATADFATVKSNATAARAVVEGQR
jgi:2-dehydro-3-deoxyphosphogluconate aldolase / (4S)-4-hydroxy-2-oxoglutarate aldolase